MTVRFATNLVMRLEALEAQMEQLQRKAKTGKRVGGKTSARLLLVPSSRFHSPARQRKTRK